MKTTDEQQTMLFRPNQDKKTTKKQPAMKLTIEERPANQNERDFLTNVEALIDTIKTDDCRTIARTIRTLADATGCDMMVGTGGSHVWIHRTSQFISGKNSHAENKRFAILTDK